MRVRLPREAHAGEEKPPVLQLERVEKIGYRYVMTFRISNPGGKDVPVSSIYGNPGIGLYRAGSDNWVPTQKLQKRKNTNEEFESDRAFWILLASDGVAFAQVELHSSMGSVPMEATIACRPKGVEEDRWTYKAGNLVGEFSRGADQWLEWVLPHNYLEVRSARFIPKEHVNAEADSPLVLKVRDFLGAHASDLQFLSRHPGYKVVVSFADRRFDEVEASDLHRVANESSDARWDPPSDVSDDLQKGYMDLSVLTEEIILEVMGYRRAEN